MIYGIMGSQISHLSKIAMALNKEISLKKVITRLSRNLSEFSEGNKLFDNYIRKIKGCIFERTILIVDDSDITKPCSSKLEGLGVIRDRSTGEFGIGYHMA